MKIAKITVQLAMVISLISNPFMASADAAPSVVEQSEDEKLVFSILKDEATALDKKNKDNIKIVAAGGAYIPGDIEQDVHQTMLLTTLMLLFYPEKSFPDLKIDFKKNIAEFKKKYPFVITAIKNKDKNTSSLQAIKNTIENTIQNNITYDEFELSLNLLYAAFLLLNCKKSFQEFEEIPFSMHVSDPLMGSLINLLQEKNVQKEFQTIIEKKSIQEKVVQAKTTKRNSGEDEILNNIGVPLQVTQVMFCAGVGVGIVIGALVTGSSSSW